MKLLNGVFTKRDPNINQSPNKTEFENKLRTYAFLERDELFDTFSSSIDGLHTSEADERLEKYGKNVISTGRKHGMLYRLKEALVNPFNIVLLAIAIITYITDVTLSSEPDFLSSSIIVVLIAVSGGVTFFQSTKSDKAAENLTKMIANTIEIYRGGSLEEMAIEDIVPGDVVHLSAGDMIPGDVVFLTTKDTFISQGILTGESNPVEKYFEPGKEKDIAITDLQNIGFFGTNIISGAATAIVVATGNETFFGSMAKSLTGERAKNSFEKGVDNVSKLILRFMIVMVPLVFIINGITKNDWVSALLFAVTVTVGLMPSMLPVIMTSTLASGAIRLSKREVIVKSLSSIQVFGEMDILCTDKTGTLTDDKIILEKYMDLTGEDDKRVLRHAYLNSYYQTGLKNLIDVAVIERAKKEGNEELLENYTRVDEIPFDFSRRRMSVVLQDVNGKRQLITKGAVEEMLQISSFAEIKGEVVPLTDEIRERIIKVYEKHNSEGLRMLAVAQKNEVPRENVFNVKDENKMVLIGYVGFLDPPKESAGLAIKALSDHGVRTMVLTGDSAGVAIKVCSKVGIDTSYNLTGLEVEKMSDEELSEAVKKCNLFSKLSPNQKERVVRILQSLGHTVGYLGDGINDAPPLHQADVGISVDSAVDIAKETSEIILLKKDLMVLEHGVIEGRKTFGNVIKYIKMAVSGNFGNMISLMLSSIFLPFLPMMPIQILTQNLLNDFSQMGIPFDNVDEDYIKKPRKWDTKSIEKFMLVMGPVSSIFDVLCYVVMWWVIKANSIALAPVFQSGWFLFGTLSQVLVIHMIRTPKIPFIQSRASKGLMISTVLVSIIALAISFTNISIGLEMAPLPISFIPWLMLLLIGYFIATQTIKKFYIRKFSEWL